MSESDGAARAAFLEAFRRHLADPAGRASHSAAEFQAKVRGSDMRYSGEPLDVAYFPLPVAPDDEAAIASVVARTLALLEKATGRFLAARTPDGQSLASQAFGWSDERLRVAAHDPGYALAIPCARFDAYWTGGDALRFLEVNTDGTSGMTNVERIGEFFLEAPAVRALAGGRALSNYALRESVTGTLLACYASWRERHGGRAPATPRIAIVDWRTVKTSAEFNAFVRWFEARGLRAAVVDPRDLSFDGTTLRDASGERVDLIYRRLVSTELFAAPRADTAALLAAYLLDAVCVVGSFRSDVAFDKRFMALLTDPEVAEGALGLDPEEASLAARVFPWTRTLRPGPVLERALEERERLVLKPAALYEGRGVRIGIETDPAVWRAGLDEAASVGGHILQERVVPPTLTVDAFEEGRLVSRPLHFSLGVYAFGGALSGFIARVASTLVLSADDDERILPVVRLGPPAAGPAYDPFQDWFSPNKLFQGGQYPKRVSSALKIFPDLRFEIQRIVVSIAPRRALEIGPGDRPLISGVRGAHYLDIVSGFLGRLEGRRVRGDVREAPFKDDAFDLVVASDVLTHIPPAERALAVSEILRLAPRALFFNPEAGTPEVKSSPVSTPMIVETLEDEGFDVERRDYVAPVTKGPVYRMVLLFGSRKGVPSTSFDSARDARSAQDERGMGRT